MILHERWFVARQHPVDFSQIATMQTAVPVAIALAVTGLAFVVWHKRERREIVPGPLQLGMEWENYQRLLSWMPLVIGLHSAVPLLVAGVQLQLFVPNLALPYNFFGGAIALAEIVVLAFTEKLWNVPMGVDFLERYPLNFFPAIGFESVDNERFILIAGTIELTFGLLLISGAFVRLMTLILWLPFNLTLPFLGWRELVGHLPIYGIMALIVIWGEERSVAQEAFVSGVKRKESMS